MAFSGYLHNDPVYRNLPDRIDEDLLLTRVQALRSGDKSVVQPIVVSLMRLTANCVKDCHSKDDELLGVAFLTLQEAVVAAATALTDDNIVPYVMSTVRRRLSDCLTEEPLQVRVPSRSQRQMRANGKEYTARSVESEELTVPSPIPFIELKETLDRLVRSHRQKAVMDLRASAYTFAEVSNILDIGQATAIREIQDLETRYNQL